MAYFKIILPLTKDPEVEGDFQKLEIWLDYQPPEPATFTYPGAPEDYEIAEIFAENGRKLDWKEEQAIDERYADEIWELIQEHLEQEKLERQIDEADYWYDKIRDEGR